MQTYLNGKITVTSLAAPTKQDLEQITALSREERLQLLDEAIERGRNSGTSTKSMEDIWEAAKAKAAAMKVKPEYAL